MHLSPFLFLVTATVCVNLVSAVPYQVVTIGNAVIYNLGVHTKSKTTQGCTSTITRTSIKTHTPRVYISSIFATNATTIVAPALTVTANSTTLLTFTSTTTTILTTTDTLTTSILATPTYTIPASVGWLPILSSLPDSSFDGSVFSKRSLLDRKDLESTNSTQPDSSIKSTTTTVAAGQCSTITATLSSTITLPDSTLTTTILILATATSTPVTTTTLVTTLSLTTTAIISSTTGVTTTTTLTNYASSSTTATFYAACATANMATSYAGVPIRAVGGDDGDGYYQYKNVASSYDCCVLAMTSNLLPRFFNYLKSGDCYLLYQQGETSGTCIQEQHEMSVLGAPKGNSIFGNAPCGRFTSGSVNLNYG